MADQQASIVRIDFDVEGSQHFDQSLIGMTNALTDLSPIFSRIADRFLQYMGQMWESEGGVGKFGKWSPLTRRYAKWKEKHYPGRPLLVRTGAMKTAMTTLGAGNVKTITANSMEVGGKGKYFRWHQIGTRWMDPRSPIAISQDEQNAWGQIVREELNWERFAKGRRA